jgi:hypothetical protein
MPGPDTEPPLNPDQANLAALAARHASDPFLVEAVERARNGATLGVALLVNGMILIGKLSAPEVMADDIDSQWATNLATGTAERPEGVTEEEWAQKAELFTSQASELVRAHRESGDQLRSEIQSLGDVPREVPNG